MQIIKSENDFSTSVEKALDEIDPRWRKYLGTLIVGSHTPQDVEDKIALIKQSRELRIPTLALCMGMQLMAIEFARNVLNIPDATSEEIGMGTLIVKKLPELRVGIRPVTWRGKTTMESHWHNYELNKSFLKQYQDAGWEISFTDSIAEVMSLKDQRFFVGVQWHPEYGSSKDKPHSLLKEFIRACSITAQ